MAADDPHAGAASAIAERDAIERLEDHVLSRRSFLAGLGLGGVGGAGAALALTRDGAGFQALATLAGGEAVPSPTRYYLPAVDATGAGLLVTVDLAFADGSGGLFVNLDGVEVRHDLQLALREAAAMATQLTGTSLDGTAVRVTFETGSDGTTALRGKSWEAGLVVALVAGLRDATPGGETLVTGVVNQEGTLLPVGGIEAKARTARSAGAGELLVPAGQAAGVAVPGIDVVEVATIRDVVERVLG